MFRHRHQLLDLQDNSEVPESLDVDASLLHAYFTQHPANATEHKVCKTLIHWWNNDRAARLTDLKFLLKNCLLKEKLLKQTAHELFDGLEPYVREDRDFVAFLASLTDDSVPSRNLPPMRSPEAGHRTLSQCVAISLHKEMFFSFTAFKIIGGGRVIFTDYNIHDMKDSLDRVFGK